MYFSTIDVSNDIWRDTTRADLLRAHDEYHQFIWSLFPPDAAIERDFLYRAESDSLPPRFFILSKRKPIPSPGLKIRSAEYAPQLAVGDRLSFVTRVNPIVQKNVEGAKNSVKHDVVMDAKFHHSETDDDPRTHYENVTAAVTQWFRRKEEYGGFALEPNYFRVSEYHQHRIARGTSRRPLQFSSVDCTGTLIVTDVEKFQHIALNGIGSARAFGCGLLVLKRA